MKTFANISFEHSCETHASKHQVLNNILWNLCQVNHHFQQTGLQIYLFHPQFAELP
jgi:hypothetical protein